MKKILNRIKKGNRFKIFLGIFFIVVGLIFLLKPSFARYIYNGIKNYYYESKSFYFNSDKLSLDTAVFQLDNWDGVNTFPITFNMDSYKNNLVASDIDIEYDITFNCTANASCVASKNSGLIPKETNKDFFTINITPVTALNEGDSITLTVKATSRSPYVKELTGEVRLNVGVPGITYEISDKVNRPYLDFKITNTLDFYKVVTPFGTYEAGHVISQSVYNALPASDKAKCTSALIKLEFDPDVILVDVTSEFYENAYDYTTQTINGKQYINSITFGMDAISSMNIRFYKADTSRNYTYPYVNPSSVITFNVL